MTLEARVQKELDAAPIVDLHTHLFAPEFGRLNLSGIDELLTYHYLIAEVLRAEPALAPEHFLAMPKPEQADRIWDALFVKRTPLSEATSGVVTVLGAFGLDSAARDLREARTFFAARDPLAHLDDVFLKSGVKSVVMTNDPLDAAEQEFWRRLDSYDGRFLTALRIDPILNDWRRAVERLSAEGHAVEANLGGDTIAHVRRFLDTWILRMSARYVAVSLPDTFGYPDTTARERLLREAILPACREHGIPFAMMIGVRRAVNPRLGPAGDGYGVSDISSIERLAAEFPENRFLVTALARENAYGLCVAARKFANILPFGCWWFMNNPSTVEQTTLMRLELLGPTFVPQHSDARILEQLIYKWAHARRSIGRALVSRYEAIEATGRHMMECEIRRDARALMGDIASSWLGLEE